MEISRSKVAIGNDFDNLKEKEIVIIGAGGTGSMIANILGRLPLKKITIIDCDIVERSNLERQILFLEEDIGEFKQEVVKKRLSSFNKNIVVVSSFLTEENIFLLESDLVIDCTDNIKTRILIDDYCSKKKIPVLYTAAISEFGQLYLQMPKNRRMIDFLKDKKDSLCSENGITSPAVLTTASLGANIAFNYLTKGVIEESLIRIDFRTNTYKKIKLG